MTMSYIEAIGRGFPTVECHVVGDPFIYENIVWDNGSPLPSKAALDQWIEANPVGENIILTKYEFRKLFTLNERIAIDNFQVNPNIAAQHKAVLSTIMKDLEVSGEVHLTDNPDVRSGVKFIEQIGLIGPGRADQILSNTPATA